MYKGISYEELRRKILEDYNREGIGLLHRLEEQITDLLQIR